MQLAQSSPAELTLKDVHELAGPDMRAVDALIRESLKSDVMLVSQVSEYIVTSGGKRLRPLIVLLAARALGYGGPHHVHCAAIIEFIHTANAAALNTSGCRSSPMMRLQAALSFCSFIA
jgi:octaprenyl-diphosphate synthase